jgi:hypothetical protein
MNKLGIKNVIKIIGKAALIWMSAILFTTIEMYYFNSNYIMLVYIVYLSVDILYTKKEIEQTRKETLKIQEETLNIREETLNIREETLNMIDESQRMREEMLKMEEEAIFGEFIIDNDDRFEENSDE